MRENEERIMEHKAYDEDEDKGFKTRKSWFDFWNLESVPRPMYIHCQILDELEVRPC